MVTLTQKEVSELFKYLNQKPYEFSAPIFEFLYAAIKRTNESSINKEPVDAPKEIAEVPVTKAKASAKATKS